MKSFFYVESPHNFNIFFLRVWCIQHRLSNKLHIYCREVCEGLGSEKTPENQLCKTWGSLDIGMFWDRSKGLRLGYRNEVKTDPPCTFGLIILSWRMLTKKTLENMRMGWLANIQGGFVFTSFLLPNLNRGKYTIYVTICKQMLTVASAMWTLA